MKYNNLDKYQKKIEELKRFRNLLKEIGVPKVVEISDDVPRQVSLTTDFQNAKQR